MESIRKKLVVIGDSMCGKTCLLYVFCKKEFPDDYRLRIFSYQSFSLLDGKTVELEMLDTYGREDYDRLRPVCYPGTDVFLMCFSVDNPVSLENIHEKWVPEVKNFCPNVPFILVANKKDLRNDEHICNELAEMEQKLLWTEVGREMATHISAYEYMECSAKTNDGVREVFETATRAALQKRHGPSGKTRSCCKLL
ncbi:rho-related GTP-binding protein RhoB-like [Eleutherodactylus coqui]|uniref:rho-related GTP-binding protein RhoB-like n=1 Tax=Eleutherodactylus coqui TaxID=57060 RepID=UPI003462BB89